MPGYSSGPSSHTSLVETTFLLCKPGGQHLHRGLLQLVADANFRVQAKTFAMPPAVAEVVARTFPSVKECARLTTSGTAGSASPASVDDADDGQMRHPVEAAPEASLLEMHVRHLSSGGSCLAMALSTTNAVNRLLAMVGPEDPLAARRESPLSLRALYGGEDVVHNAIHASTNLADAGLCISAVFGYEAPTFPSVVRNTAAVVVAAAAAATAGTQEEEAVFASVATASGGGPDSGEGPFAVPRPDLSALRLSAAGADAVTLAELLQRAPQCLLLSCDGSAATTSGRCGSSARQTLVEGDGSSAAGAESNPLETLGHSFIAGDGSIASSATATAEGHGGEAAAALSRRQLAQAWEALARQREHLRLKEMDIFLREAALRSSAKKTLPHGMT